MAKISLRNVTKIYEGKVTAIEDVILDVADGEFMVIVGPSGCGKTTTLRVIAGLEEVTKGTIMIGDKVVNEMPPKDRDVAMVFQNYALYPHMTVFQNMAFGLKLRKYTTVEIRKRVAETATLLGIQHVLERKPSELSGGQRQRAAVGRAIVRNPKAFLFDEPLSNLDAQLRATTQAELKVLHRRLQTTSIYVTHNQVEAMTLGDRICIMHNGVIQQIAEPMEVYDRPVNKFVAGFFGTPPMNFFNGRIDFEQDVPQFMMDDSELVLPKEMKNNLAVYKGKELTLGIRPEHLHPSPAKGQNNRGIRATVDVIELLGDETHVYLTDTSGQKFVVTTDPHTKVKTGNSVIMYIDTGQVHIFELREMGKNINLAP